MAADDNPRELILELEPAAKSLSSLMRLDLRNSSLVTLPSALPVCAALKHLDIGGNPITSLRGIESLTKLAILFASDCALGPTILPGGELSRVSSLRMISVKNNGLTSLDGNAFPANLHWLIATSNQISKVTNVPRLKHVRKLMLSHNQLTADALEPIFAHGEDLEMIRIACNPFDRLPKSLAQHPKLAWVAMGGSPYAKRHLVAAAERVASATGQGETAPVLSSSHDPDLSIDKAELGRGSGATVVRGTWKGTPVAVKLWTSECFSDGDAQGEWEMGRIASACLHVVRTLAVFKEPQLGMCMELLEGATAASGPPSFDTVTRDALDLASKALSPNAALTVALTVARACAWLHSMGIIHGDVYLHNTLYTRSGSHESVDNVRLSDLGAAGAYDMQADGAALQKVELRSFSFLVEDLIYLASNGHTRAPGEVLSALQQVAARCKNPAASGAGEALSFAEIVAELEEFHNSVGACAASHKRQKS